MQTSPAALDTNEKLIKSFPAFITETKEEGDVGYVTAFVAVMGNIDHHMEVIVNGAFKKTIAERWQKIRVLDNHNFWSASDAIAKITEISEVTSRDRLPVELRETYPDATGGLLVTFRFMIDNVTDKSYQIFKRIKNGFIDEYSIGFNIIKSDWRTVQTDKGEMEVRFITEIKLFEVSPVIFAANDATMTVVAKNEDSQNVTLNIVLPELQDGTTDEQIKDMIRSQLEPYAKGGLIIGDNHIIETAPETIEPVLMPHSKAIPGYGLAEADESCKNCKFYKAVTEKNGYCEHHGEAVGAKYLCDTYEKKKDLPTVRSLLKTELDKFMINQVDKFVQTGMFDDDDKARMNEVLPVLVDNFLDLMPSDILGREMPDEGYTLPKSDEPEAEPVKNEPLTSVDESFKNDSQRRIAELRKRQLTIRQGG